MHHEISDVRGWKKGSLQFRYGDPCRLGVILALKNRGRGEIIALILDVATQGTNKTKIMYSAYLSSAQLKDYLTFLQASGLVRQERGGESYKTTEKGRRYLQKYRELDEMIESEVSKVDQRRA